jgi:signal transduction histidine kinase
MKRPPKNSLHTLQISDDRKLILRQALDLCIDGNMETATDLILHYHAVFPDSTPEFVLPKDRAMLGDSLLLYIAKEISAIADPVFIRAAFKNLLDGINGYTENGFQIFLICTEALIKAGYFSNAIKIYTGLHKDDIARGREKDLYRISSLLIFGLLQSDKLDKAVSYIPDMLRYSAETGIREHARAMNNAGNIYLNAKKYDKALQYYQGALHLFEQENDMQGQAMCLNNTANIYKILGDPGSALDYDLRSLALKEKSADHLGAARTLGNIANIYVDLDAIKQALVYYEKSVAVFIAHQAMNELAITYTNQASAYLLDSKPEKAIELAGRAVEIALKIDDQGAAGAAYLLLAEACEATKQYKQARDFITKARKLIRFIPTMDGKSELDLIESKIMLACGNIKKAADIAAKGISRSEKNEMTKNISDFYFILAECAARSGDIARELQYIKSAQSLLDKYNSHMGLDKARKLQILHSIEKGLKDQEIHQLRNIELADALEKVKGLNVNLEELNKEKNILLGIVAHDLKNPLSSIKLLAQLLERENIDLQAEDLISISKDIRTLTDNMFSLIQAVLNSNAIESGQLHIQMEYFDLHYLIKEIASIWAANAKQKNINVLYSHLSEQAGDIIYSDPGLVRQILDNLLSNAIKYSERNTTVTVTLSMNPAQNIYCIHVLDQGQGIKPEEEHKLFRRFAKLSARPTAGEHSTGLGLSIVEKLAHSLDGNVYYRRPEKPGAEFILELPAKSDSFIPISG